MYNIGQAYISRSEAETLVKKKKKKNIYINNIYNYILIN